MSFVLRVRVFVLNGVYVLCLMVYMFCALWCVCFVLTWCVYCGACIVLHGVHMFLVLT